MTGHTKRNVVGEVGAECPIIAADSVSLFIWVRLVVSPFLSLAATLGALVIRCFSALSAQALMDASVFGVISPPLRVIRCSAITALQACLSPITSMPAAIGTESASFPTVVQAAARARPFFSRWNSVDGHPASDRPKAAVGFGGNPPECETPDLVSVTHPIRILVEKSPLVLHSIPLYEGWQSGGSLFVSPNRSLHKSDCITVVQTKEGGDAK